MDKIYANKVYNLNTKELISESRQAFFSSYYSDRNLVNTMCRHKIKRHGQEAAISAPYHHTLPKAV